jgi:hypothetical protein
MKVLRFGISAARKLKIRVSNAVGWGDNEVGLIASQVHGENFLSEFEIATHDSARQTQSWMMPFGRLFGENTQSMSPVPLPREARTAIPAIPRFCIKLPVSIHPVMNSMATQTHLANHRRVPRALNLLVAFPEACPGSGHG